MRVITHRHEGNEMFLYPIGDIHVGDKAFTLESKRKLLGYIDWVKKTKNAYVFLNGDLVNCASRKSKTSPFECDMTLREQIDYVVEVLTPIKHKILGAVTGNHEFRMEDQFGYNPTIAICDRLGIPYAGFSCVLKIQMGSKNKGLGRRNAPNTTYVGYFHHTNGGGSTLGGKINRTDKLRQLVSNCDFYCGSHNHLLGVVPVTTNIFDERNGNIIKKRQVLVNCGGYLDWEGYPEYAMLPPVKIGSPRIRFDGTKKDIHVSV